MSNEKEFICNRCGEQFNFHTDDDGNIVCEHCDSEDFFDNPDYKEQEK